jgi:hypothetical protein
MTDQQTTFPAPTTWSTKATYRWDLDVDVPGYEYGHHVTSITISITDSDDNDPDIDDGLYVEANTAGWRLKRDGTRDMRGHETRWLYFPGWSEFIKPYHDEALRLYKEAPR